jgi:hypothetical protein
MLGDILEGPITSVAIQFVWLRGGLRFKRQGTTVDKINIEPTIVIEIEQGDAPAHDVAEKEVAGCPAVVAKSDSRSIGNILETRTGIVPGRSLGGTSGR